MLSLIRRSVALLMALLLALAVASPAIAEIGCSWDTATHFGGAEHDDGHEAEVAGHDDSDSEGGSGGDTGPDTHCAFSHGHGDLAGRENAPVLIARPSIFAPSTAASFVSSVLSGLDRPPRG